MFASLLACASPDAAEPDAGTDVSASDQVVAEQLDALSTSDTDAGAADIQPPPDGPSFATFIGDWTMQPGSETTRCVIKKLTNDKPIRVSAIQTALSPGSHHLIVYRVDPRAEKPTPFKCQPFAGTLNGNAAPLMISQVADETLRFPPGVAIELEAHQTLRIEAHYLNYFPEPITAHADVTFHTTEAEDVVPADFLFYGNIAVVVPPRETVVGDWMWLDAPDNSNVFAITGHTHRFGTNVEVLRATGLSDEGTPLYPLDTTFQWDESPVVYHSPPISFAPGEGFRFRCSWTNTSDAFVFFGESADQEMCFLWAYYYPSNGFRVCAPPLFDCPADG